MSFPGGSDGEESACNAGDLGLILVWEDVLEEDMATHSSILAQKTPWTEEPGGFFFIYFCPNFYDFFPSTNPGVLHFFLF